MSNSVEVAKVLRPELQDGGWRQVNGLPASFDLFARFETDAEGREVVREVVVRSPLRIASYDLQRIPLATVERIVNARNASAAETPEQVIDGLGPLFRRKGEATEVFAERVALHYRAYSAVSRAPATLIAAKAGIPSRRVHFWIVQARRLGKLPPGRQGAAG